MGQASMQSVHEPQPGGTVGVTSTSTSVTSVPSTTQEPWVRVMSIVFLPMNPTPERSAPARSTWWFASTSTR